MLREVKTSKFREKYWKRLTRWVKVCGTSIENLVVTNQFKDYFNYMSVDIEIYMNNIIKFFRENPTDLLNLVPKDKEEYFYTKIKEVAIENYEKGDDVSLTQSQLIDVCSEINQPDKQVVEEISKNFIQKTKFGYLFLN